MALAASLTDFGPIYGAPDWLISGVWLCVGLSCYLATASTEVCADGYVARPLNIDRPDELAHKIDAELPDISGRLLARGNGIELPRATELRPASLTAWPEQPYSTSILLRVSKGSTPHRVACGLLFATEGGDSLLVGTDVGSMAMVLSQDPSLVGRYLEACNLLSVSDYLSSYPN
jgi:hypothetical protein